MTSENNTATQSETRPRFEEVLPGTYLLKIPFGVVWTGIILIRGEQNILIDSSHLEPEQYLIPALADLGLQSGDIDWLLNTHVHGDHIGGHHALVTKYGLKTATLDSAADALRDPVKVAIRVRTRFPRNSPPPQSYLKGVEPDLLLKEWRGAQGEDALPTGAGVGGADVARASSPLRCEGDLLAGRFAVVATPGHDDDCLTWIDTKTGTAFTGDSLQANGTPTQGVGFYRNLPAYRTSLEKLKRMVQGGDALPTVRGVQGGDALPTVRGVQGGDALPTGGGAVQCGQGVPALTIQNIVCGHDYDGIGDVIRGREAVAEALRYCKERVELYGKKLREYVGDLGDSAQGEDAHRLAPPSGSPSANVPSELRSSVHLPTSAGGKVCGQGVPALTSGDESVLVPLALKLIDEVGCGRPQALFLALHTVSEHLKELNHA